MLKPGNIQSKLQKIIHSWLFYHILFWVTYVATVSIDIVEYTDYDMRGFLVSVFLRTLSVAAFFYTNLLILIPKFLRKRKYLLYTILLITTTSIFLLVYRNVYFISTTEVFEIYPSSWVIYFSGRSLFATRFLLYSFLFDFLKGWFDQEKRLSQMTLDKITTELNYLRAQINPHFLFNTLNNIYGLALKKSDRTPEAVMRLSEMMEYMLYESDELKVPLEKEINNVINYIEIEKLRQGNNAQINIAVSGESNGKLIGPMLLLPLLENGIKHGINSASSGAYLKAELQLSEHEIKFRVENSKLGALEPADREGVGIINLKKRLELLYPNNHYLLLKDDRQKYLAQLTINI